MEGRGPTDGTPVKMDLIIAGTNVVATDATACRLIGVDPQNVKHIRKASEKGLGSLDPQVLGEKISDVAQSIQNS